MVGAGRGALLLALSAAHGAAVRPSPLAPAPRRGNVERVQAQCTPIAQCYCIRGTPCGWCKSHGRAMVGTEEGPLDAEQCPDWVAWAEDCPMLLCQEGEHSELFWYLHCGWFPVVCLALWLTTYCWRESLYDVHMPEDVAMLAVEDDALLSQNSPPAWDSGPSPQAIIYLREQLHDALGTRRSFEAFRQGLLCPPEDRLPEVISRPYELNLSVLSVRPGEAIDPSRVGPYSFRATLRVALQWRTALGSSLVVSTGLMFASALYLALLRSAARWWPREDYLWLAMTTMDLAAVAVPLQKAVGMLLSFYALDRVARYWRIMMEGCLIQGRSADLGMICGVVDKDSERAWRECYRLYRHVTLNVFFTYHVYAPVFKFVGYAPLVKCGLLEPEEVQVLKAAHREPLSITESWIAQWISENLRDESRQQAFQALRELRASSAVMQAMVEQRAPVSFESLLFLVVYFLIAVIPFAPSDVDYTYRQQVMEGLHVATVVGDGIICAFYISLLHMLRHLQSPFDDFSSPNDALSPVAILNSVERKLRDYLGAPDPAAVLAGEAPSPACRADPPSPVKRAMLLLPAGAAGIAYG